MYSKRTSPCNLRPPHSHTLTHAFTLTDTRTPPQLNSYILLLLRLVSALESGCAVWCCTHARTLSVFYNDGNAFILHSFNILNFTCWFSLCSHSLSSLSIHIYFFVDFLLLLFLLLSIYCDVDVFISISLFNWFISISTAYEKCSLPSQYNWNKHNTPQWTQKVF